MSKLRPEVEPDEVGLDAARLRRIDEHFVKYVESGKLPGWLVLVARHGKIAHLAMHGWRDIEAGTPVETDTLFRIFSMTKPITSVAAMTLYEEGAFELSDPVSRFLPEFAEPRVYVGGTGDRIRTRPATEPIRIAHLLTHTSGLTYGFHGLTPVDERYRRHRLDPHTSGSNLEEFCARLAAEPLLFDPGTSWNYSLSVDVLGRVIEVVSGQTLDEFLHERVLAPLGMNDTAFTVPDSDTDRLAALYTADERGKAERNDRMGRFAVDSKKAFSGGGGLVSTAHDYHRFNQMLVGGGELDGVRVLSNRTLRYMALNHLPGGVDLSAIAQGSFSEVSNAGRGFGLGFAVVLDPVPSRVLSSPGELSWGGMASTSFWVDPLEDLTVLFLTQLAPSNTHPIRSQLHQLIYQALVD
jgi:CubicO group peptidase (beta-lactamase class C family)